VVVICIDQARAISFGMRPTAKGLYIDLGTAAQTMLLAAHSLGPGGGRGHVLQPGRSHRGAEHPRPPEPGDVRVPRVSGRRPTPGHAGPRTHHLAEPDRLGALPDWRRRRELIGIVNHHRLGSHPGLVIGSQIGKDSERTVATIGGTIVGVLIGGVIGRSMDQADHACIAQTLEHAPAQHGVAWSNPDGGHYRVVPLEGYEDGQGRICRDYRTTATIEGRQQDLRYRLPAAGRELAAGAPRRTRSGYPEADGISRR
jgi:surface antigen